LVEDGRKVESFIEPKEEQRKNGGPDGQYKLAQRFVEPESRDLTLAYHFVKLAAHRVPEAMMQLYDLLSRGDIGDPLGEPKHEAARHYLKVGSRVGHIPGMVKLSEVLVMVTVGTDECCPYR
jgi:hypothetical protein